MCTGLEIAAIAGTLASTAGTAYVNDQTNKKQDRAAAASIRNQRDLQREQNQRVQRVLSDVDASNPESERVTAEQAYLDQVQKAQGMARNNLSQRGLSTAYDEGAEAAGDQAQDYAGKIAGLMARIDAPVNQRVGEGFSFADLSTDIGQTQRQSAGQQWIDQLKMKSIRANPYLLAAASAVGGLSGLAGSGGGNAGYVNSAVKGGRAVNTVGTGSAMAGYA